LNADAGQTGFENLLPLIGGEIFVEAHETGVAAFLDQPADIRTGNAQDILKLH
jgi:hypothetical protein